MTKPVSILGIHDGHNCGATLTLDGVVAASVNEERLTRNKNEVGYPCRAIEEVLRIGGVDARDLDEVVYASNFMHAPSHLQDISLWYAVGLKEQRADASRPKDYARQLFDIRTSERIDEVAAHLGIAAEKVHFVEHHLAHLAAAYFTAPNVGPGRKVLGLTCDGAGDNLAATVSVCAGSKIERISETDRHASLGKIYSRMTYLMGMTPWEHEYKLMGLAPYADPERSACAAGRLKNLLKIADDALGFALAGELSTNYCYEFLRDAFERERFDVMAGAVQLFTEDMLQAWVRGCIEKTGISDLVCGGGVFMNVKANMLLAAMPEVSSIYVMPSAADESLAIGAGLLRYYVARDAAQPGGETLANLYLGADHDGAAEKAALAAAAGNGEYEIGEPGDIDVWIADKLAAGDVVARSRGRMEWGARALGNRSILASADDWRTVDRINRMIKQRDFWMPFAPSIRAESAARYFDDPKHIEPRYMTFAFAAKPEGYTDLVAGSHPFDRTLRPQIVEADTNPGYHKLLTRFEELTGRGGVLNTSFNLHGFPIVNTPADAIDVFVKSDLDHLALNHHTISRRREGNGA